MQWASSTASSGTLMPVIALRNDGDLNRSGATYTSRYSPRRSAACRSCRSPSLNELLTKVAAMPRARSASTWSFISARSGETTMVVPSRSRAGSW